MFYFHVWCNLCLGSEFRSGSRNKRTLLRAPIAPVQHPVQLLQVRPANRSAEGLGPRAALRKLGQQNLSRDEKEAWIEGARIDAILGNCSRSLASVKSGFRCYTAFAGEHIVYIRQLLAYMLCL